MLLIFLILLLNQDERMNTRVVLTLKKGLMNIIKVQIRIFLMIYQ